MEGREEQRKEMGVGRRVQHDWTCRDTGVHTVPKKDGPCSQVEPNTKDTTVKLYVKGDYKEQRPIKHEVF